MMNKTKIKQDSNKLNQKHMHIVLEMNGQY